MDCETYKLWISRWIDDELGGDETAELERHIAACSSCAAYREDLLKLRALFGAEEAPSPSPGLKRRVMAKARGELAVRRTGAALAILRRMAVAAMLLTALTVGLFAVGNDPVQAVDAGKEIHYEDLFEQVKPGEEDLMLEVLSKTTHPREALRLYFERRRSGQ